MAYWCEYYVRLPLQFEVVVVLFLERPEHESLPHALLGGEYALRGEAQDPVTAEQNVAGVTSCQRSDITRIVHDSTKIETGLLT